MKFNKKLSAGLLTGVMALSLSAPAFAGASPSPSATNQTVITGQYKAVDVAVTVPNAGTATINPYGLPIEVGDSVISGEQITTPVALKLENRSAVAMSVSATVTGAINGSSDMKLVTSDTKSDWTQADATSKKFPKEAMVKFQMFKTELDEDTAKAVADVNAMLATLGEEGSGTTKVSTAADGEDLVISTTAATAEDILVLNAGAEDSGKTIAQIGGIAIFRLAGEVSENADWAATDGFTATIAFTFKPGTYVLEDGTVACSAEGNIGTTAATLTLTPPNDPNDDTKADTVTEATWEVDKTSYVELVPDASDPTKATIKKKSSSTAGNKDVKVTVTYKCAGTYEVLHSATIKLHTA